MSSAWAVLVASGKGEKFSAETDTAFLTLGSRPVITYSLAAFEQCPDIAGVVVVAPRDRVENVRVMVQMYGFSKVRKIVAGTAQRQTSVLAGLKMLDENASLVVLHDASRPCVTSAQIAEVLKSAKRNGSGVLALRTTDAPKVSPKAGKVQSSLNPADVWLAVYPQAFQTVALVKGYELAQKKKLVLADDSEAVALLGKDVHLVISERPTVRITGPVELALADCLLRFS
jgi:2-C-methyl-D-erythritol 4-phosphate cytidylyltransferase